MRPLIWVSKSMDKLAETLTAMGHPIGADTVRKELVKLGFSRQHNRKRMKARSIPTGTHSSSTSTQRSSRRRRLDNQ